MQLSRHLAVGRQLAASIRCFFVLINFLPGPDGSRCTLTYDETGHWLRATWSGFVDVWEAQLGAQNYLNQLDKIHCAYLLNDNSPMKRPGAPPSKPAQVSEAAGRTGRPEGRH